LALPGFRCAVSWRLSPRISRRREASDGSHPHCRRKLRLAPSVALRGGGRRPQGRLVPGLPYVIVYHVLDDTVFVLRVMHTSHGLARSDAMRAETR